MENALYEVKWIYNILSELHFQVPRPINQMILIIFTIIIQQPLVLQKILSYMNEQST